MRRPASQLVWIMRQLAVVVLGLLVYFGVRGLTEGRPAVAVDHAHDVVGFESHLGLDKEHQVQQVLRGQEWLTDVANWVYIWGHWPVIIAVFVWLALRHRPAFLRLRNAMILSGAVGLVIFAAYPVAPPRLAHLGLVDTVTEQSHAYRVLQPPAFVNQYAAMPSLHVGWDLLVGIAVVTAASSVLLKVFGVLMPVLMTSAVVLTANHYVIDGVAGAGLALAGLAAAVWLEHRFPSREQGPPEHEQIQVEEPVRRDARTSVC